MKRQKSRLFEYAILLHPLPKKADDIPPPSEVLIGPASVLAQDENKALILASREIPEDYLSRLEEVEIAVRPF